MINSPLKLVHIKLGCLLGHSNRLIFKRQRLQLKSVSTSTPHLVKQVSSPEDQHKLRGQSQPHISESMANNPASTESTSSRNNKPDQQPENEPKFSVNKEELKARLSPIQFQVTQLKSTERPGTGEYNNFNQKGAYHCIVCDEKLFTSDAKYESGCGWPAFFEGADMSRLKFMKDCSLVSSANLLLLAKKADMIRTEVLCANCDAHLGHRFDDGPKSKGGKRYCINSAALKFKPMN